jgi:3-deoxy-manno-octulosonate cytidylyltransferase (CMP-KDO synthetase)
MRRVVTAVPRLVVTLANALTDKWRVAASLTAGIVGFVVAGAIEDGGAGPSGGPGAFFARLTGGANGDGHATAARLERRRVRRAKQKQRAREKARRAEGGGAGGGANGGMKKGGGPAHASYALGVVVASYESVDRMYPGRPLAVVHGKPAFARAAESAKRSTRLDRVVVATDDFRIVEAAKEYGLETVLVTSDCEGTLSAMACEAARLTGGGWDYVCACGADEPLIESEAFDACMLEMEQNLDEWCVAATCVAAMESGGGADSKESSRPKCVADKQGFAMYVSNGLIPVRGKVGMETLAREQSLTPASVKEAKAMKDLASSYWQQVEIMCWDADYLRIVCSAEKTPLQAIENLEILNTLENGYKVRVTPIGYTGPRLYVPGDLKAVEETLVARITAARKLKGNKNSPTSALEDAAAKMGGASENSSSVGTPGESPPANAPAPVTPIPVKIIDDDDEDDDEVEPVGSLEPSPVQNAVPE